MRVQEEEEAAAAGGHDAAAPLPDRQPLEEEEGASPVVGDWAALID